MKRTLSQTPVEELHARLAALGIERSPDWIVPSHVLRSELRDRGWPCSDAVLEAEETTGGLPHWPGGIFGVHASLSYLNGEAEWERDDLQDYGLVPAPRDASSALLPVFLVHDPRVWLALDGRIVLGGHIDGFDNLVEAFEDTLHYWEVLALLDAYLVALMRPLVLRRPRLEATSFAGRAIASELGLSPFAPATRGTTRAWSGPGGNVVDLELPGFKVGTDVVADTVEGIVLAASIALDAEGAARITSPEPLDADLLKALPVPTIASQATPASHVYVWGKWSSYENQRYRKRKP